jgi:hypothetical protein
VVYVSSLNGFRHRGTRVGFVIQSASKALRNRAAPDKICWVTTVDLCNHHGALPVRDGRGRTGPLDSCCTKSMTDSFRSGHGAFPA